MAEATITTRAVQRTVEEEVITLTLSVPEAETLLILMGCINGCPREGRRVHTAEIFNALRIAGVYWERKYQHDPMHLSQSITLYADAAFDKPLPR